MARLLLATTGSELVIFRLAEQVGVNRATAEIYQPWIEAALLVHRLPAWSRKVTSRVVRRPAAADSGIAILLASCIGRLQRPASGCRLRS